MNYTFTRLSRFATSTSCLMAAAGLSLVILTGCSGFGGKSTAWLTAPWSHQPEKTAADRAGIKAPYQRMTELQETAKTASSMSAEERQRTARSLAEQFRTEGDPLIRAQMVRTMANLNAEESSAALRAAMEDSSVDVRIAACYAWGARPGSEAIELLGQRIADDANIDVRLAAARALGETGDEKAVPKLGMALEDSNPALQYRAVLSLQKVTGKRFDNDVNQWRQYVKGETPTPSKPTSVAERLQWLF